MRLDALFQAPASFPTSAGRIFPQTISTWIDKRESIGVAKTCPPALNIMRLYQSKGDHSLISHPRFHILKKSIIAILNDQVVHKVAWLKQKMSLLNCTAMSNPEIHYP